MERMRRVAFTCCPALRLLLVGVDRVRAVRKIAVGGAADAGRCVLQRTERQPCSHAIHAFGDITDCLQGVGLHVLGMRVSSHGSPRRIC